MNQDPRMPEGNNRWDTDRIRRFRRRLVGATILLLIVLLVVPMLDSEPKIDEYSISLNIPQSPGTSELPMSPNDTARESSPVILDRTEIVDSQALPPLEQVAEQPVNNPQNELAQIEAEKRRLEEKKRQLERQQNEQVKQQEALKKQEEQRRREALKKEEERKKQEELKRQQAANQQAKPTQPEKEAGVNGGQQKPRQDDTARAVAILEGGSTQKPAQSGQATQAATPAASYVIQVGAYQDSSMLESLKTKIAALGLKPFTEATTKDGIQKTRLRVGPFKDRSAAEAGLKRLNTIGLNGIIVSRNS